MQSVYLNTRHLSYDKVADDLEDLDKRYFAYKLYKVGKEPNILEMLFNTERIKALCSGFCQVDEFIDKTLKEGREECKEDIPDRGKIYGEERIRYKRCVIERSKYKNEEYEMW